MSVPRSQPERESVFRTVAVWVVSAVMGTAILTALTNGLRYLGWKRKPRTLRTFERDGEIIEIEIGGADTSGHYLHHMKAEIA